MERKNKTEMKNSSLTKLKHQIGIQCVRIPRFVVF